MSYLKRLYIWILEGKCLYIFLILLVLAFSLNRINLGCNILDSVRYFGLALELGGTSILVHSIGDKLFIFKGYGLSKFLADYFRSIPLKRKPKHHSLKVETVSYSMTMGELRGTMRPKEDLKDIIRYFDGEIKYLHKKVNELKSKTDLDQHNLKSSLESLKTNLLGELTETKERIENSAVSNIWLELFGLSCIILGIIMATAPDLFEMLLW